MSGGGGARSGEYKVLLYFIFETVFSQCLHFEVSGLRLTHNFISSLPTFVSIFIHPCPLCLAALGATRTDLHDQTARKNAKEKEKNKKRTLCSLGLACLTTHLSQLHTPRSILLHI